MDKAYAADVPATPAITVERGGCMERSQDEVLIAIHVFGVVAVLVVITWNLSQIVNVLREILEKMP